MKKSGYEILIPLDPTIDVPDLYDTNYVLCDTDVKCVDVGCSCPIDGQCGCGDGPNELDCSYRMGNR